MPVPNEQTLALGLLVVALAAAIAFVLRRAPGGESALRPRTSPRARPSGSRRCAGIIVFGSLMGAAFISQQYLQNVLGYSTLEAGAAILPAVVFMVLVAPRSAKLVGSHGSRAHAARRADAHPPRLRRDAPALAGGHPVLEGRARRSCFLGVGVGLAGTPSSNSLTGSVPVTRVGMASGTADLQRDLGGALMTSIFGALLTAGYASAMGTAIAESGKNITESTQAQLQLSFASAENLAAKHPTVRGPDHGRGPAVVPRRRPLGVPGRDRRGPDRHGARLPLLPEARRRRARCGRRTTRRTRAARRRPARLRCMSRGPGPGPAPRRGTSPRPGSRDDAVVTARGQWNDHVPRGLGPHGQLHDGRPDRGVDERA